MEGQPEFDPHMRHNYLLSNSVEAKETREIAVVEAESKPFHISHLLVSSGDNFMLPISVEDKEIKEISVVKKESKPIEIFNVLFFSDHNSLLPNSAEAKETRELAVEEESGEISRVLVSAGDNSLLPNTVEAKETREIAVVEESEPIEVSHVLVSSGDTPLLLNSVEAKETSEIVVLEEGEFVLPIEAKSLEISSVPVSLSDSLQPPIDDNKAEEIAIPKIEEADSSSFQKDLIQKIVRQVEYYFSDENLPSDKFLLKFVRKNKEGYVPIGLISSFRKMKKLVENDDAFIAAALRTSSLLVVSKEGKRVKRLHPLPAPAEPEDTRQCTVVVENLPLDSSEESLRLIFASAGEIRRISIRNPGDPQEDELKKISAKLHALVEYATPAAAEHAAAVLNDWKNWRNGLRVELLSKRMERFGFVPRVRKPTSDNGPGPDGLSEPPGVEAQLGRRRARGKGGPRSQPMGPVKAAAPVGPRMPDGTRGFSMGRGKAMVPTPSS